MGMSWVAEQLTPALGAVVHGVDLGQPVSDAESANLQELLDNHLVLVFRDQKLTNARHVELGQIFGTPFLHPYLTAIDSHPEILEVRKEPEDEATFGGEFWHSDISFRNPPAAASLLYAHQVPPLGGDTIFANQYLSLEALSPAMRDMLRGLRGVHLYPGLTEDDPNAFAVHPIVRRNHRTGREALFLNGAFVRRFEGMTEDESRSLLDFLFAHQVRPEFTGRVSWEPNQLTLWDNRATLHYAMNDYTGFRRILQRVTSMEVTND